jgi:hypothetical protein
MTGKQFRAALRQLGLTQVGTARLLGVNEVTVRRWIAHGTTGVVAILLRLMLDGKVTPADVETAKKRAQR